MVFLSVKTWKIYVYSVPIGNSPEWLMMVLLIMMERDWSKNLRATNNVRYFTGRFTELSISELPNSMMTGVI